MDCTAAPLQNFLDNDNRMLTHVGLPLLLTLGAIQCDKSSLPRIGRYTQKNGGQRALTNWFGRSFPHIRAPSTRRFFGQIPRNLLAQWTPGAGYYTCDKVRRAAMSTSASIREVSLPTSNAACSSLHQTGCCRSIRRWGSSPALKLSDHDALRCPKLYIHQTVSLIVNRFLQR